MISCGTRQSNKNEKINLNKKIYASQKYEKSITINHMFIRKVEISARSSATGIPSSILTEEKDKCRVIPEGLDNNTGLEWIHSFFLS